MKLAVNARLLRSPVIHGWNRYAINLLSELHALGVELFLYTDYPLHPSHVARLPKDRCNVRLAPELRYMVWQHSWVPRQCAADQIDIFHTPFNYGLPWSDPCRRVLTLCDAIENLPDTVVARKPQVSKALALKTRFHNWIARTRADHIITLSEHSSRDIVNILHVPEGKITAVYLAADSRFEQPAPEAERRCVRQKFELLQPYILSVGPGHGRKNLGFLIRAFGAADLEQIELVVAGDQGPQRAEILNLAAAAGVGDRVRFLGPVDDCDLPALYAEAYCFVYPSRYEGFGLQLCEAMSSGCPTFAARASCFPEVLGAGGDLFALDKLDELVALLRRVVGDGSYRSELVARAKSRAADFSWRRTAEQTLAVYCRLLQTA